MDVLNLSDLHFAVGADAETQFSLLAEDLRQDLYCTRLDAIILAGDIANLCRAEEYALAVEFVNRLVDQFRVPREAILIIPGNHDVDWSVTQAGFQRVTRKSISKPHPENAWDPGKGNYVHVCDAAKYETRFEQFSNFYRTVTGKDYSLEYDKQYTVIRFEREGLIFAGMNSAWCLDHLRPGAPAIRARAVNRLLDEMSRIPSSGAHHRIAVWHHPIHSGSDDRIRDIGFIERLTKFGFRVGIHGHVHEQGADWFRYDSGRGMEIIATGTFGAPTRELPTGSPWEYNLLKFGEGALVVESRYRIGMDRPWRPYGIWPEGPTSTSPRYTIPLRRMPKLPSQMYSRSQLLEFVRAEGMDPTQYRLAVEANIFNAEGKLLLQKRGAKARDERGKYEGVGGELGDMQDLHDCLRKEIGEEIGSRVVVNVDTLFEVRPVVFEEDDRGPQDWIIVSYLCRLVAGNPKAMDAGRTGEIRWFSLAEAFSLQEAQLSRSTFRFLQLYREKYQQRPYYESGR
jgi:ADP-ribose pyrophosphatase YjhB (NUDIX family)